MTANDSIEADSSPVDLTTPVSWDDLELKLGILAMLNSLRRKDAAFGGASLSRLHFLLFSWSVEHIKEAVDWLVQQGFAAFNQIDETILQITVNGVDFLADQYKLHRRYVKIPNEVRPPGSSGNSWWQPPPPPPDDNPGVRKNPYPIAGSGAIALPLPEPPPEWI